VKETVVNQSTSDSVGVVVTLCDGGKCCGTDEVGQYENTHVDNVYAIALNAGEVKI
jgi:hypothetical protein